jgi:hypothetical protein
MRSDARRLLAALAVAGLALTAAACTSGGQSAGTAGHKAPASAVAAAGKVPAATTAHGVLNARLASTAYRAVIVPVYPTAVKLADALAYNKPSATTQIPAFTTGLSKTLASMSGVTAFPKDSNGAFIAYRAQAQALLATLAHPAAVTSSVTSRRQTALALYGLAREIGQLGINLHLVPATESGGKH